MNKSWLSDLSNVQLPKRKATRPSERLLSWARQPAQGLWASGREAPPVRSQESSNENLLGVSHRDSVTARFGRNPFFLFHFVRISPRKTVILKDIGSQIWWMDFGGRRRGWKEETERRTQWWLPVHHCSFSQSGSCYFLAVTKMLLNRRLECELESRSPWLSTQLHHTHTQLHLPLRCWLPSFQLTVLTF